MASFGEVQCLGLLLMTVFVLQQTTTCTGADWSYDDHHGKTGPSYWKDAHPTCAGANQSPINIVLRDAQYKKDMAPIVFDGYDSIPPNVSYKLENNGHTVQLGVTNGGLSISGGGLIGSYQLVQFHIHWGKINTVGSEHTVNGKSYPMEIHFVHYSTHFPNLSTAINNSTGLAVIGVFVEIGEKNSAFDNLIQQLSSIKFKGQYTPNISPFKMADLLPAKTCEFIRYPGSLTTPGCFESVVWTVLQYPIKISEAQLNAFRALSHSPPSTTEDIPLVNNFRPIQKLGTRKVVRTFAYETPSATTSIHRFHGDAALASTCAVLLMLCLQLY